MRKAEKKKRAAARSAETRILARADKFGKLFKHDIAAMRARVDVVMNQNIELGQSLAGLGKENVKLREAASEREAELDSLRSFVEALDEGPIQKRIRKLKELLAETERGSEEAALRVLRRDYRDD